MSALKAALEAAGISIKGYDPNKANPIRTHTGSLTISKFSEQLRKGLKLDLKNHPEVLDGIQEPAEMERLIEEYALEELDATTGKAIPPEVSHLTLNVDTSSTDPGLKRFFCTTPEEFRDISISGQYYTEMCALSVKEATPSARPVVPRYLPRRAQGIHPETNKITQQKINYFNNYVPAGWELFRRRNPSEWAKIPSKPPEVIIRMIKHVIPNKEERNYFYAWLYTSITKRAYVYLVLCGNPGVGKNRLKLLMRALHGEQNASDGKKETFGANESKFNSQMEENTFLWFDELSYGPEMEPRMKEYQNDYISIEKKGIDSTRSTEIYCSMVISNNYARNNYLLFNSRKFAPLVLGSKPLTAAMTPKEINDISERLDDTHPRFDVKFVSQIAKWITSIGPKYVKDWPNLEYRGPMFWKLAGSSMSRWQKIAVLALTTENKRGAFAGWDESKKGFLWSKVEEDLRRKKEYESKDYRDPTTVKAFFENYCDIHGTKVFEVESEVDSIVQDFWIKPIGGLVKRNITISLNDGQEKILEDLVRPAGTSEFKWRKMKEEHKAILEGLKNVNRDEKDSDLL